MTLRHSKRAGGFTLLELLAVVATIATLAALLLPVLSKARIRAQRTTCLSNLRQLGQAWMMYNDENNRFLVQCYPLHNPNVWVFGDMQNPAEAGDTDLIQQGKLYPYNQNVGIYRCPADLGVVVDRQTLRTVRSYSMNCFMGGRDPNVPSIPPTATNYLVFVKDSDIRRPSEMWVLVDEDERTINDGFFVTDPLAQTWVDFPASSAHRHNYSFALDFADGHSEIWRQNDPRTYRVTVNRTDQNGSPDLEKLARASTVPK